MHRKRIIVRSYITLPKMINDTSFASTLIIPSSMGADVYAYALLLVATLLCMIACFIVWYVNRYCELMNVSAYLDSLDSL